MYLFITTMHGPIQSRETVPLKENSMQTYVVGFRVAGTTAPNGWWSQGWRGRRTAATRCTATTPTPSTRPPAGGRLRQPALTRYCTSTFTYFVCVPKLLSSQCTVAWVVSPSVYLGWPCEIIFNKLARCYIKGTVAQDVFLRTQWHLWS